MKDRKKLIKELLDKKIINQQQLKEITGLEKTSQVFAYIEKNYAPDIELLTKIKADYYGLNYKDLSGEELDKEVVNLLSSDLAETYQLVIFAKEENKILVGIVNPSQLKGQEAVEFIARQRGWKIEYYLISKNSLKIAFKQYSALSTEVKKALDVAADKLKKKELEIEKVVKEDVEQVIKSAPISKMVEVIIRHGVELKASDIHVEPFIDQTRVRYRIDGVLRTLLLLPKAVHAAIISRVKVMANLKIDETRVPQDGRIRLNVNKQYVDFRISTLPLYDQEKVVMRILDTSSGALTLDQLGFEGRNREIIENNIDRPTGMFLVTGPTGSGKSTTLYSVLNIVNREGINIVTLEDPVEYYLKGINQSQINPDVGLTFATGLRSILRQDPDVVMVGEIRDSETAGLAIHAALTGHFVLSTLHTNDAFGAIPRLIDMKVEPFLLTSTLNLVIAQRLVRKICVHCKEELALPDKMRDFVWNEFQGVPKEYLLDELKNISDKKDLKFYHGKGCARCHNSGYGGRLAIAEVLDMNDNMKALIASGDALEKVRQDFVNKNMLNIQQDGIMKALRGLTTMEEIMRVTKE